MGERGAGWLVIIAVGALTAAPDGANAAVVGAEVVLDPPGSSYQGLSDHATIGCGETRCLVAWRARLATHALGSDYFAQVGRRVDGRTLEFLDPEWLTMPFLIEDIACVGDFCLVTGSGGAVATFDLATGVAVRRPSLSRASVGPDAAFSQSLHDYNPVFHPVACVGQACIVGLAGNAVPVGLRSGMPLSDTAYALGGKVWAAGCTEAGCAVIAQKGLEFDAYLVKPDGTGASAPVPLDRERLGFRTSGSTITGTVDMACGGGSCMVVVHENPRSRNPGDGSTTRLSLPDLTPTYGVGDGPRRVACFGDACLTTHFAGVYGTTYGHHAVPACGPFGCLVAANRGGYAFDCHLSPLNVFHRGIAVARIDPKSLVATSPAQPTLSFGRSDQQRPAISCLGTECLLVWLDDRKHSAAKHRQTDRDPTPWCEPLDPLPWDLLAIRIDAASGKPMDAAPVVVREDLANYPAPGKVEWSTPRYPGRHPLDLLGANTFCGTSGCLVAGKRVKLGTGSPTPTPLVVFAHDETSSYQRDSRYTVSCEGNTCYNIEHHELPMKPVTLVAHRVDGMAASAVPAAISAPSDMPVASTKTCVGSRCYAVWYDEAGKALMGGRVGLDGKVGSAVGARLGDADDPTEPGVGCTSERCLVAWVNSPGKTGTEVRAVEVNLETGAVTQASGFPIVVGVSSRTWPVVTLCHQAGCLVSWSHRGADTAADVHALYLPAGAPSERILVTASADEEVVRSVAAADPGRFVFAYQRLHPAGGPLRVRTLDLRTRVLPDGGADAPTDAHDGGRAPDAEAPPDGHRDANDAGLADTGPESVRDAAVPPAPGGKGSGCSCTTTAGDTTATPLCLGLLGLAALQRRRRNGRAVRNEEGTS